MKAKLIRDLDDLPGKPKRMTGTVVDHPDAFRLVQMGVATPEDDECRIRADRTEEQMVAAQMAYTKLIKAGIQQGEK